jgi:predicted transcriptional regulator
MAEKEEAKKPVVEMSIWFVLLLVVLIISTCLVIKINGEKATLAEELTKTQARVEELQKSRSDLQENMDHLVGEITSNPGNYSTNQVISLFKEKLSAAGLDVEVNENLDIVTPVVTEVDSGEVEQVVE